MPSDENELSESCNKLQNYPCNDKEMRKLNDTEKIYFNMSFYCIIY